MATRALATAGAGSRVAGQSVFLALASIRSGGARSNSRRRDTHTRVEERDAAAAAQVEAELNSKNVVEVAHRAPGEAVRDTDAAWVPDQGTGIFVPAEVAAASSSGNGAHAGSSVLDQTVFNREEEMEDVERPAVNAGAE